jgi:hypothetical protein
VAAAKVDLQQLTAAQPAARHMVQGKAAVQDNQVAQVLMEPAAAVVVVA